MAVGSYSMVVNRLNKTVDMVVSGTFEPHQADAFIKDYNMKLSAINPKEYVLQFDCRDMDLVTQENIPDLEKCFKLYSSSDFSKVIIGIKEGKPVLSMQLKRLARNVGLKNMDVQQIY